MKGDAGIRSIEGAAYVCFWPKRDEQWWARRFGHVSIVHFEDDAWFHQDLHRNGYGFRAVHKFDEVQEFLRLIFDNSIVLRVPVGVRAHFFAPLTCVSFVKHALGVDSRALWPDGLYRDLRRDPRVEVVNVEAQNQAAEAGEGSAGQAPA